MQMIWSISPGKMTLNKQGGPQISFDILEAAVAAQPNEPMLHVQLAQARANNGQTDAALRELRQTLSQYPNLAPARLELAKGLRAMGRIDEAERELKTLLETNPLDALAHHQLGHILEQKGHNAEAKAAFEKAEDYHPGDWGHFRCHAQLIFRTAALSRDRLNEARELFNTAIEIGGANAEAQCKSFLAVINRRMKQTPPTRTSERKKTALGLVD